MNVKEMQKYVLSSVSILEQPKSCNAGNYGEAKLIFTAPDDNKIAETVSICRCWGGCSNTYPLKKLEINASNYADFLYLYDLQYNIKDDISFDEWSEGKEIENAIFA